MQPLYVTLSSGTSLIVIPDVSVYQDGHPIISYTYSIFINRNPGKPIQALPVPDYIKHPDYAGFITIEEPGKLFTYTGYSDKTLTMDESEELIEYLMHLRENSNLWPTEL